jgi:hypothetical protein
VCSAEKLPRGQLGRLKDAEDFGNRTRAKLSEDI